VTVYFVYHNVGVWSCHVPRQTVAGALLIHELNNRGFLLRSIPLSCCMMLEDSIGGKPGI